MSRGEAEGVTEKGRGVFREGCYALIYDPLIYDPLFYSPLLYDPWL